MDNLIKGARIDEPRIRCVQDRLGTLAGRHLNFYFVLQAGARGSILQRVLYRLFQGNQ